MHRKRIEVLEKFNFILDEGETITIYKTKVGNDSFLVVMFVNGAIEFDKFSYKNLLTCKGNMPFSWYRKDGQLQSKLEKPAFESFLADFQKQFRLSKTM